MSDDRVLDAAQQVLDDDGLNGAVVSGVLVYEWIAGDGRPAIGWVHSDDIRNATLVGLLEWAKAHALAGMLSQPEIE